MDELDANTWSDTARSIARLRRRLLRCQLGMVAVLLIMVPILAICEILHQPVEWIFFVLFPVAAGAFLLVGNATWLKLIGIRCPRCGERFIAAFGFGFLRNRCKHCGLDLDLAAIAKPKLLDGADLLE